MGVFEAHRSEVFAVYDVELTFTDRVVGGVPKDPKIIEGWLRAKAGVEKTEEVRQMLLTTLQELGAEIKPDMSYEDLVEASQGLAADKHTTGFKRLNGTGLYLEARQVDAMLKESANVLYGKKEQWGKTRKGPKNFMADNVFATPHRIPLGRQEPDGVDLAVIHAMGRSALAYYEYVDQPVVSLQIEMVDDYLEQAKWARLWLHAERNGLGSRRSQGEGKFEVTKWQRADPNGGVPAATPSSPAPRTPAQQTAQV